MLSPAATHPARAGSADRGVRVQDPVLAKYHAIKREIEQQARSRPQTPSRLAVRNPITPETRAALRTLSPEVPDPEISKVRQLESELRLKEHENASLRDRVEAIEVATKRAQILSQQSAANTSDAQNSLRLQLHDVENERDKFRHQLEEIRVELSQAESGRTRAEALLQSKYDELQRKTAQLDSCQRQLEQTALAESSLRQREATQRSEVARLEQLVAELRGVTHQSDTSSRDELRKCNKEIHELRLELVTCQQHTRELESKCERTQAESDRHLQDLTRQEKQMRDLQMRFDALRSTTTQDKVVFEDTKAELSRHSTLVLHLRDEVQMQESVIAEYQIKLDSAHAELRLGSELSAQLDRLQQALSRKNVDIESLEAQVGQLRAQLTTSEQRVLELQESVQSNAQLEALAAGRAITIEKMRNELGTCRADLTNMEEMLNSEKKCVAEIRAELNAERDARTRTENEIRRLETELQQVQTLEETIGELNDALADHRSVANRTLIECRSWQAKCADLEARTETFQLLEEELQQSREDNCRLVSVAEESGTTLRICQQQLAAEAAECQRLEEALARERTAALNADHEARRLASIEAEMQQSEARLRQSQAALQSRTDDLTKERDRFTEIQLRLKEREALIADERSKRADAESECQRLVKELSALQAELGKLTVTLDAAVRDKLRLEKEVHHKSQVADARQSHATELEQNVVDLQDEIRRLTLQLRDALNDKDKAGAKEIDLGRQLELLREENSKLTSNVHAAYAESTNLQAKLSHAHQSLSRTGGLEAELQRKNSELTDAVRSLTECREALTDLSNEVAVLKRVEARCHDAEAQASRSQQMLLSFETDVASLSAKLVEKEKEMWRFREAISTLSNDLDSERSRRAAAEAKLATSEQDREKAAQLEGQLAGLAIVAQTRARDLEESRNIAEELRDKLRKLERSTVQRGADSVQLVVRELESKIAARDQAISQLEMDSARKEAAYDSLRLALSTLESQKKHTEIELARCRSLADRAEAAALQRQMDLERATDENQKQALRSAALVRAGDEAADLKHRNTQLQIELAAKQREVDSLESRLRESSVRRSASIESELRRTKVLLDATASEKQQAELSLREKQRELEIASGNIETLRSRVRSDGQWWSEKRKELSLLDDERAREYAAISQESVAL